MLYGAECWPVKNSHIQRLKVAEMKMLRWLCGLTRGDRVRNETIWEKVGVASVEDKMEIAKHLSLPPVKLHCSMLAEDAIKAAVKDYETKKAKFNGNAETASTEKTA
ncbi:Iron sulfur cluster assembly protein 2, mitochondrial [Capsicum annuum]|nr:Iron sulfur cluster assembly protein 2, mitochondrial [Capsicum annuum]